MKYIGGSDRRDDHGDEHYESNFYYQANCLYLRHPAVFCADLKWRRWKGKEHDIEKEVNDTQ